MVSVISCSACRRLTHASACTITVIVFVSSAGYIEHEAASVCTGLPSRVTMMQHTLHKECNSESKASSP